MEGINEKVLNALKEASRTFEKIAWKRPLDSQPTKREIMVEKLALVGRDKVDKAIKEFERSNANTQG